MFPEDRSLGRLTFVDHRRARGNLACEARGAVPIPAGTSAILDFTGSDSACLSTFEPDDLEEIHGLDSDEAIANVSQLVGLRVLELGGLKITDAGLAHLSGLVNLYALWINPKSNVTGNGLVHLLGMSDLRELYLEAPLLDGSAAHISALATLRQLYLWDTRLTQVGFAHLPKLCNLDYLEIGGTKLSDTCVQHLALITSLRELSLSDARDVSDAGVPHLRALTNLEALHIEGAQITDAGLLHLQELRHLRRLTLRDTHVTDAGIAAIQGALPLCAIICTSRVHPA